MARNIREIPTIRKHLRSCAMEPIVVEVVRGEIVESRHLAHAVAVHEGRDRRVRGRRAAGHRLSQLGQADPGLACRPGAAGPRRARGRNRVRVAPRAARAARRRSQSAREGAGTEDELECGAEPTPLEHNCSGKHAGDAGALPGRRLGEPRLPAARASVPAGDARGGRGRRPRSTPLRSRSASTAAACRRSALTLERMAYAFSRLERLDGGARRGPGDA